TTAGAAATGAVAAAAPDGAGAMFGRAGFLPYSGLFGSQLRFFSASAASCSAVRCGTLLTKGTGTLVTYSATPSATAKPTIRPLTKPPRCDFIRAPISHSFRRADAQHAQRIANHLAGGAEQRQPRAREFAVAVDQEAHLVVIRVVVARELACIEGDVVRRQVG